MQRGKVVPAGGGRIGNGRCGRSSFYCCNEGWYGNSFGASTQSCEAIVIDLARYMEIYFIAGSILILTRSSFLAGKLARMINDLLIQNGVFWGAAPFFLRAHNLEEYEKSIFYNNTITSCELCTNSICLMLRKSTAVAVGPTVG
jgi:hypothetical protein